MQKQVLNGVFKGGVVVLDNALALTEGTRVQVLTLQAGDEPQFSSEEKAELQTEFALWERAADEDFAAFETSLEDEENASR